MRIKLDAVKFRMPQLNPVQSAARIAHLGARPGAPVFAERLAERKSRRHIESYRLVTSFKRASIIATQFVNPAADGKGKSRGDGIVLTAGYGKLRPHTTRRDPSNQETIRCARRKCASSPVGCR